MNLPGRSLALLLGTALIAGCNAAPKPPDAAAAPAAPAGQVSAADIKAVRDLNASWFAHYNAHHPDSLAALYAEDAVLMMPGQPTIRGRDAIKTAYAKDIADMVKYGYSNNQGKNSEVTVSGDIGWESNTFTVTDKTGKRIDAGKYVTVFGRKDGKWVIVRDIWNSDDPSPST